MQQMPLKTEMLQQLLNDVSNQEPVAEIKSMHEDV